MRVVLLYILCLIVPAASAQQCEIAVRNWCYRHAVSPDRNCADLVRQACPRLDFDACVANVIGVCNRSARPIPLQGDGCASSAVAYCARQGNDRYASVLNEADYCARRRGPNTGEYCLSEALRIHNY